MFWSVQTGLAILNINNHTTYGYLISTALMISRQELPEVITMLVRPRYQPLSRVSRTWPHPSSVFRNQFMLSAHPTLVFHQIFRLKFRPHFWSVIHVTWPAQLILLDLTILTISSEEYKLLWPSLCNVTVSPVNFPVMSNYVCVHFLTDSSLQSDSVPVLFFMADLFMFTPNTL
jgi:hypothetical protein